MKKLLLLILQLALCSCSSGRSGIYYSACSLQGRTEAVVQLKENSEFEYNFAYGLGPTKGRWRIVNDTLVLNSKSFTASRDSLAPRIKFNYNDTIDKFILKSNRIYPVVSKGRVDKRCYLKKQ